MSLFNNWVTTFLKIEPSALVSQDKPAPTCQWQHCLVACKNSIYSTPT